MNIALLIFNPPPIPGHVSFEAKVDTVLTAWRASDRGEAVRVAAETALAELGVPLWAVTRWLANLRKVLA